MTTPRFKITVERSAVEENQEIGHQWERTGRKNEKGEDVYDYSPSVLGSKEVARTVFQRECAALDLDALSLLISRCERAAKK
jgi:hypothetical protein